MKDTLSRVLITPPSGPLQEYKNSIFLLYSCKLHLKTARIKKKKPKHVVHLTVHTCRRQEHSIPIKPTFAPQQIIFSLYVKDAARKVQGYDLNEFDQLLS